MSDACDRRYLVQVTQVAAGKPHTLTVEICDVQVSVLSDPMQVGPFGKNKFYFAHTFPFHIAEPSDVPWAPRVIGQVMIFAATSRGDGTKRPLSTPEREPVAYDTPYDVVRLAVPNQTGSTLTCRLLGEHEHWRYDPTEALNDDPLSWGADGLDRLLRQPPERMLRMAIHPAMPARWLTTLYSLGWHPLQAHVAANPNVERTLFVDVITYDYPTLALSNGLLDLLLLENPALLDEMGPHVQLPFHLGVRKI